MGEGAHKNKQRTEMTDHQRYIAVGNDKADELAQQGAEEHEAEMAEFVAREVKESKQRIYSVCVRFQGC